MNTRDGKHIFITIWRGVAVEGANVTSCLFPSQPSGSEGQTDDIHKERERLRLVLKQMGRIKCPSEVCITSFFLSLSLSFFPTLHSVMSFRLIFQLIKVLFPPSSCANLSFVFSFYLSQPFFPWGLLPTSWPETHGYSALLMLQCKKRNNLKCPHTENLSTPLLFHVFLIKFSSCYIPITSHQRKWKAFRGSCT